MQLEIERDEAITDKVILIQKAVRGLRARQELIPKKQIILLDFCINFCIKLKIVLS